MKIAVFIGSGNKNGNTATVIKSILQGANDKKIDSEIFYLCDYNIKPCLGCRYCEKKNKCIIKDDDVSILHEAIKTCDALVVGTPTYYGDITGQFKQFTDRVYPFIEITKNIEKKEIHFGSILKKEKPGILVAISGSMGTEVFDSHIKVTKHLFNDINAKLWRKILVPYTTWHPVAKGHPVLQEAYEAGIQLADYLLEKNNINKNSKMT